MTQGQCSLKARSMKTTFQKEDEDVGELYSNSQGRNGQEGGPLGWEELEEGEKLCRARNSTTILLGILNICIII